MREYVNSLKENWAEFADKRNSFFYIIEYKKWNMKHYFDKNRINTEQTFMFIKMLAIGILIAYLSYHVLLFFTKTINNL